MEGNSRQQTGNVGGAFEAPFFIAAAHELKAPLALIRQLSLAIESFDYTAADRERMVRQITLTSEQALRLTTNLTKASRLEDSLFTLEPLNPVSVCEEVATELSPLFAAKGKRITVLPRRQSLLAIANKDLLRRVIANFADNALHYSGSNEPVVMAVHAYDKGKIIRLGVRDFGPAVPAKTWQNLESSLGNSAQAMHSRPASSGLGMYIAAQFAQVMNGRVGATRHKDGATFYVDVHASTQMSLL